LAGRSPRTYTFGASIAQTGDGDISRSDLLAARRVAQHLSLAHDEIIVERKRIAENAVPAIFAAELHRGTFVDDAVIYFEVARTLSRGGVRTVLMGEAGDDVFGCFPSMLRFYRGQALQYRLRRDLMRDAPTDYAAIQRIFSLFGIQIFDPFLEAAVVRLGYRLPLDMRIDSERLMKPVLRRAFAGELPPEIVSREKRVSRDVSGVREIMAEHFGCSRERYLKIFTGLFRNGDSVAQQAATWSA
jgi:asparagine synthetase B (glutamine-hydrolysing)